MSRDTVKNRFSDVKRSMKKMDAVGHAQPYTRTATHGRHTVMWLSGFKFTLRVDDWMRGH